jgi:hypothetical protein
VIASHSPGATERRVESPRAGSLAGILFAVTFSVSVILIHVSSGIGPNDTGAWLATSAGQFSLGVGLMPFAGVWFLWFMAVVRTRLGRQEDQFFSTVFLGSGLLFLGMVFVATGAAGGLVAGYTRDPAGFVGSSAYFFGRSAVSKIFAVYAVRMAALFMSSLAKLWMRTKVMPRWMGLLSYAIGLVLLFAFSQSVWFLLVFPAWVFLLSVYFLLRSFLPRGEALVAESHGQ